MLGYMCMEVFDYLPRGNESHEANTNTDYDKYYYLYEFTDDIIVTAKSRQYPCIQNYVKTGILTPEEVRKAVGENGKKAF